MGLPVLGYIAPGGKVKRVVAPAFRHAVRRRHRPALLSPLGVTGWVAVELHPFRSEVTEEGDVSGFWVEPGERKLGPLHRHVDAVHSAHFFDPREGVLSVQDDDKTGAVAGVLLLPDLQQLVQMQTLSSLR